ncbi:DUF6225 family protein [Streptomyces sp. NPDC049879]|uniref:DUF6225 family protein n=1 Tax=Streptomyces sp. NPDC049879 TaxID=3365598 RepID=UPI003794285F
MTNHTSPEPQRSADRWATPAPLSPDNPITDPAPAGDAEPPAAWTVGKLRAALAQYDDDTPLRFAVPEPGDDQVVDTSFVAVAAGFGAARYADERGTVQDTFVTVDLETTGRDPLEELMNYAQPRPAAGR